MERVSRYLASNSGRMVRGIAGILMALTASLTLHTPWLWVVSAIGLVLFSGALFDICLLGLITHRTIQDKKIRNKQSKDESGLTTGALFAVGLVGALLFSYTVVPTDNAKEDTASTQVTEQISSIATPPSAIDQQSVATNEQSQTDLLLYLIEEEKLAHDVYTVMYDIYGVRVFGNILNSEETHQSKVLTLLQERNIADPRSKELGKFSNANLQALYDKLIAQGKQNAEEAYKVGVAIEELDIKDITKQLATATESDIVATLEELRKGSENHLRAFNRQLGKY